jgi:hypothetical protein
VRRVVCLAREAIPRYQATPGAWSPAEAVGGYVEATRRQSSALGLKGTDHMQYVVEITGLVLVTIGYLLLAVATLATIIGRLSPP